MGTGATRSELWAIASGKGGVGRSFLTANLGYMLAREQGPVTLVDTDCGGGNLHTFLGLNGEGEGLGSFLQRRTHDLNEVTRFLDVPGLKLVSGVGNTTEALSEAARIRLLQALRRLDAPRVLLDLESGSAPQVLELFARAERPILLVIPEPAAVEDAHGFIRRWYLGEVKRLAGRLGLPRKTFDHEVLQTERRGTVRPMELLARIDRLLPGSGQPLSESLAQLKLYLVLNQVRHVSDFPIGLALKQVVQSYFGISVRFAGAIGYDPNAWLSTRRRRLRVREAGAEPLTSQLSQLAKNLLADQELDPPEPPGERDW